MSSIRVETVPIEVATERSKAAPAVLGSWKEIAHYLGKSVRSVQRWESELGLPVHRPGQAGIVLAYPTELDCWVRSRAAAADARDRTSDRPGPGIAVDSEVLLTLMTSCFFLAERCSELEAENRRLLAETRTRRPRSVRIHLATTA